MLLCRKCNWFCFGQWYRYRCQSYRNTRAFEFHNYNKRSMKATKTTTKSSKATVRTMLLCFSNECWCVRVWVQNEYIFVCVFLCAFINERMWRVVSLFDLGYLAIWPREESRRNKERTRNSKQREKSRENENACNYFHSAFSWSIQAITTSTHMRIRQWTI